MLILGALALLMGLVIWTQQRSLIYFPFGQVPDPSAMGLKGTTAVTFPTADGLTLNGWFIVNRMGPGFVVRDGTSAPSTIDPLAP